MAVSRIRFVPEDRVGGDEFVLSGGGGRVGFLIDNFYMHILY